MKKEKDHNDWCNWCGNSKWGWVLLILGIYWFAREVGWLPGNVPIFPTLIIVLGLWFILKSRR